MKNNLLFAVSFVILAAGCSPRTSQLPTIGLTLIPPYTITTAADLDVRGGVVNAGTSESAYNLAFYLDGTTLLKDTSFVVLPGSTACVKFNLDTENLAGEHQVTLVTKQGAKTTRIRKPIEVIKSDIRSTKKIEGAFMGFYHWSEQEGKMWNPIIKDLTPAGWKELTHSMTKLDMNVIVMQESFRNQAYVGQHSIETEGYPGLAFYDSQLFPGRMPIATADPIEAVMTQADKDGMNVFVGVGMYAWFDYTEGSLEWHKKVASELWQKYGHHPSFYGFYVSEEGMGSLDCFETDPARKPVRQQEVLRFFREFTPFVKQMAPDKPVMFAPNGWSVGQAFDLYPELLANVDIICPFAFARMPVGDLTGVEAVSFLQNACDAAGAHMWLDLEAFLFNEAEGYLVPRPIEEIKGDLLLFDNFEKVVCYQYPGVFNDPSASVRVGEESTVTLFNDYLQYISGL